MVPEPRVGSPVLDAYLEAAAGTFSAAAAAAASAVATSDAVFVALAFPRRPVVTRARTTTANPQATMIHQPRRAAAANPDDSGPCRFAVSTDPTTATPSTSPTWRLADAIPAATPACSRGIPDTAEFVIGAFTMPIPTPNTR